MLHDHLTLGSTFEQNHSLAVLPKDGNNEEQALGERVVIGLFMLVLQKSPQQKTNSFLLHQGVHDVRRGAF